MAMKKFIFKIFSIVIVIILSILLGVYIGYYQKFPFNLISKYKFKVSKIIQEKTYDKNTLKCIDEKNTNREIKYNFFVAGHPYGSPNGEKNYVKAEGLYPFFLKNLKKNNFDFGIFAGDIVKNSTNESWDIIDKQISKLNYNIYFAPGNHDVGLGPNNSSRKTYTSRYNDTYYHFFFDNDLFIILDSNLNNWHIKGEQLEFFKSVVDKFSSKFDNLFIIVHHLIWIENEVFFPNMSIVSSIVSNLAFGQNQTNFWDDMAPTLLKLNKNIFFISGDYGQYSHMKTIFCKKYNNIKFIATGMGGGIKDNYLSFEKLKNKDINIRINYF